MSVTEIKVTKCIHCPLFSSHYEDWEEDSEHMDKRCGWSRDSCMEDKNPEEKPGWCKVHTVTVQEW